MHDVIDKPELLHVVTEGPTWPNRYVKRNRTKSVDKYYTHHPNVPKFGSLMKMTSISKNVLSLLNLLVVFLTYFD